MNEDELKDRTKRFALRVMKLAGALPDTPAGRVVRHQLVKAGTSVGASYRAACRARSKAEFIAKLGIVDEEADEGGYWLELIMEGKLMKASLVRPLLDEANELARIMASSRMTAAGRSRQGRQSEIGNQK